MNIKLAITTFALLSTITSGITADLPSDQEYMNLSNQLCNSNIALKGKEGSFTKKPLFALRNTITNVSVNNAKTIETWGVHFDFNSGDYEFFKDEDKPKPDVSFYKTTIASVSNFRQVPKYFGSLFSSVKSVNTTTNFNNRGIGILSANSYFDYEDHPDLFKCDNNYVYVQDRPTSGGIQFVNPSFPVPTGTSSFKLVNPAIDSYSRFAQEGQPMQIHWKLSGAGWNQNITTTSPTAILNAPYAGNYDLFVRIFDGNFYSDWKKLSFYANGSSCSPIVGCEIQY